MEARHNEPYIVAVVYEKGAYKMTTKCPHCKLVYTGNHDLDKCEGLSTVDEIFEAMFKLPIEQLFELMAKINEKMLEVQQIIANAGPEQK